ncbi:MAG TPA: hypothetical protein VNN79_02870 [Actinomycetota bacterium]|nr:hypothetical protein [Actinomycetota bacterium]
MLDRSRHGDPPAVARSGIDLYWLPLGAGGRFVAWNGRRYEAVVARRDGRAPAALYHTALEVRIPGGRYVVENAWPIPDAAGARRGVVVEGPVGWPVLGRFRVFRYEIRRWRDGRIPDVRFAVASPQPVGDDPEQAHRLLAEVPAVPPRTWGRIEPASGDMWNSNSVIAWLLTRAGIAAEELRPPPGGRAPGWRAGIEVAGLGAGRARLALTT